VYKNGDFCLEAINYDLVPSSDLGIISKKVEESCESCLWNIIRNVNDNVPRVRSLLIFLCFYTEFIV